MDAAAWTAIYGAVLSTALAVHQIAKSMRRLRVTSCPAYNSGSFRPSGIFIRVTIANHGSNAVYVRNLFLNVHVGDYSIRQTLVNFGRYRRWRRHSWVPHTLPDNTVIAPQLPTEIAPGRSLIVWLPATEIKTIAQGRRVRLRIQDEMDRTLRSPDLAVMP